MTPQDIHQAIVTYLPWILSIATIYMTLLAGNKHPRAWAVGLATQRTYGANATGRNTCRWRHRSVR